MKTGAGQGWQCVNHLKGLFGPRPCFRKIGGCGWRFPDGALWVPGRSPPRAPPPPAARRVSADPTVFERAEAALKCCVMDCLNSSGTFGAGGFPGSSSIKPLGWGERWGEEGRGSADQPASQPAGPPGREASRPLEGLGRQGQNGWASSKPLAGGNSWPAALGGPLVELGDPKRQEERGRGGFPRVGARGANVHLDDLEGGPTPVALAERDSTQKSAHLTPERRSLGIGVRGGPGVRMGGRGRLGDKELKE